MAAVCDILAVKGYEVLTIGPEASTLEASRLMERHRIGSLVVTAGGDVAGIISERDIVIRVVARRLDPQSTLVGDVMNKGVFCCRPHTELDEARGVMKNRRIRHLPVVDDDSKLCGLISIGDLNAHQAHDNEQTVHLLQEFIFGRT